MTKTFDERDIEQRQARRKALARDVFEYVVAQIRQFGGGEYPLALVPQHAYHTRTVGFLGPYEVRADVSTDSQGLLVIKHPELRRLEIKFNGLTPAFKHQLWKRLLHNMPVDPPVEVPITQQRSFVRAVKQRVEVLAAWRMDCEAGQLTWETVAEETHGTFHAYLLGPNDLKLELEINADRVRIARHGGIGSTYTPSFRRHGYIYTAELEQWMLNFIELMFYSYADHDAWVAENPPKKAPASAAA